MINIELINILSYELSLVIRYVEITKCKIKRKKIGYKMKHNILQQSFVVILNKNISKLFFAGKRKTIIHLYIYIYIEFMGNN